MTSESPKFNYKLQYKRFFTYLTDFLILDPTSSTTTTATATTKPKDSASHWARVWRLNATSDNICAVGTTLWSETGPKTAKALEAIDLITTKPLRALRYTQQQLGFASKIVLHKAETDNEKPFLMVSPSKFDDLWTFLEFNIQGTAWFVKPPPHLFFHTICLRLWYLGLRIQPLLPTVLMNIILSTCGRVQGQQLPK